MNDMGTILVTGGTGTLGRLVVDRLRSTGRSVRVMSRRGRGPADDGDFVCGDLATGEGIDAAVRDVALIVHCAGSPKGDEVKARHLVQAASRSGVRHIVNISVVGADRVPMASGLDRAMFGYYGAKLGAEQAIAASGIPWTTVRATQFHSLILTTVRGMSGLPVIPVPSGFRFQPVDPAVVADRLVELALVAPAGLVPDIAGPQTYAMSDLLRTYFHATGRRRLLLPMPMPGRAARAVREGAILSPGQSNGGRTWEAYLAAALSRHAAR
jgi:uncharacterized protein YbjT (DUF2867 family)